MNDFLFSPTKQFLFPSGKILAGGKIYVFIKHTDNLATLYNDEDVEIANPVILDSNGRATVKADDTYDYKLDVYSPYDELLFTATSYLTDNFERDFAITSTDGSVDVNVSIDGYTTNWDLSVYNSIKGSTSGKFDTSAFENFYTNTYGPTIGNIYHKIDDISATISGGYGGKLDVTAFNLYSAGVRGDLNIITGNTASISYNTAMLDEKVIQNMNNINAVSGGLNTLYNIVIPEIRTDIVEVSGKLDTVSSSITNKLDTTAFNDFISNSYSPNMSTIYQGLGNLSANKEDKITWEYNNDGEISAANGSALAGKGYYSKYAPYGVRATSGNLIIEGSRYPHQSLLEVSGENGTATAGIIPPVPKQNLSAVRYLVAASGSLADVEWKELPQLDTFSGVTTDSTLTGDGKNDPLGVADIQSLSSDSTINITSSNDAVILGVNMPMLTGMIDNAKTEAVASAQSGLIRDISFEMQNVGIFGDSMSGYNADGTVWIRNHWTVERAEASGAELNNYLDTEYNTNYISMSPSAKEVFDAVRTNSASWSQGTTYSSVSGTVIVSGNDLEISSPAIRNGVPWEVGGWLHSYDDSTAFNAGFPKNYNSYRLEHIMSYRQYPNPAHTGFSAELIQLDANYNTLSSTMLYGIFDFEFTPVPNCDMIWLYCSGTSAECQRGVIDYYRTGNHTQWVENLAWENDTPTRNEFANLYENIAVNSGNWGGGTSIDFHYIEV